MAACEAAPWLLGNLGGCDLTTFWLLALLCTKLFNWDKTAELTWKVLEEAASV